MFRFRCHHAASHPIFEFRPVGRSLGRRSHYSNNCAVDSHRLRFSQSSKSRALFTGATSAILAIQHTARSLKLVVAPYRLPSFTTE
jgi:hypothetical protein